jgi:hypothetical protein
MVGLTVVEVKRTCGLRLRIYATTDGVVLDPKVRFKLFLDDFREDSWFDTFLPEIYSPTSILRTREDQDKHLEEMPWLLIRHVDEKEMRRE